VNPQKIAKLFAWIFLATWATSIPARLLFVDNLGGDWSNLFFTPGGSETAVYIAAILEFLLIVTNIGTAVVLYPVVKRQSEIGALGYLSARIMESAFILVGLLSLLSIVTLRQDLVGASGAQTAAMTATGNTLVNAYEWSFLFGPGLVVGFGNGLILGYLMYRSGLVPRRLAMLGLIAGPLLILGFVLVLFDVIQPGPGAHMLLTLPEMVWELSLPIYLLVKGFRPSPITTIDVREPAGSSMAAV
jgi:hypothetical protein